MSIWCHTFQCTLVTKWAINSFVSYFLSFPDSNFLIFFIIRSKMTIHYLYELSIISSCVFDTSLPSSMVAVTLDLWHFSLLLPQESNTVTAQGFSC